LAHMVDIIIYETGKHQVDVRMEGETLWLSLQQLADLFERDKSVISRHLKNIFESRELDRDRTVAKNATVQMEGEREVIRQIENYNLDAIIPVGYRVNSSRPLASVNEALAGLTLFIAVSRPDEMDTVKRLMMVGENNLPYRGKKP
jgi:hypothetical protein